MRTLVGALATLGALGAPVALHYGATVQVQLPAGAFEFTVPAYSSGRAEALEFCSLLGLHDSDCDPIVEGTLARQQQQQQQQQQHQEGGPEWISTHSFRGPSGDVAVDVFDGDFERVGELAPAVCAAAGVSDVYQCEEFRQLAQGTLYEAQFEWIQTKNCVASRDKLRGLFRHQRTRISELEEELAEARRESGRWQERHRLDTHTLERQLVASGGTLAESPVRADNAFGVAGVETQAAPPRFRERIPRFPFASFSNGQYLEHARSGTPFILEGSPLPQWSAEQLLRDCPDAKVFPTWYNRSGSLSRQEYVAPMPLRTYVAAASGSGDDPLVAIERTGALVRTSELYVLDNGVALMCPSLLEDVVIPAPFSLDFSQIARELSPRVANHWPSMFIGGANGGSYMHSDFNSTAGWIGLISGRKRWVIVPAHERGLLEEVETEGYFGHADLLQGDWENDPVLSRVSRWDAVQGPGDIVFIPARAPHQVDNLEAAMGVAFNFVDDVNAFMLAGNYERAAAAATGLAREKHRRAAEEWASFAAGDVRGAVRREQAAPFLEWKRSFESVEY